MEERRRPRRSSRPALHLIIAVITCAVILGGAAARNPLPGSARDDLFAEVKWWHRIIPPRSGLRPPALIESFEGGRRPKVSVGTPDRRNSTGMAVFIDTSPVAVVRVYGGSTPRFVDIDADGDLDLFVGARDGTFTYYLNTGDANEPSFVLRHGADNPLATFNVGMVAHLTVGDLDGDGDYDVLSNETGDNLVYLRNDGSRTEPAFVLVDDPSNPVAVVQLESLHAPFLVDIDADGDLDLFIGYDYGYKVAFYENTGTANEAVLERRVGAGNPMDNIYGVDGSAPMLADMDDDGDYDAYVTFSYGSEFYRNVGSATDPAFQRESAGDITDWASGGEYRSAIEIADLDGDGDLDYFGGEPMGTIAYAENIGTASSADFLLTMDAGDTSAPAFADLDDDGDFDLVAGTGLTRFAALGVAYYENVGTPSSPEFEQQEGTDNPFEGLSGSRSVKPALMDIDGDGDVDLMAGQQNGRFAFYENVGTTENPTFELNGSANPLGSMDIGSRLAPAFADLDADGDHDIIAGHYRNSLAFIENIGTPDSTSFVWITGPESPVAALEVGHPPTPALTDTDGDCDLDLFTGEYGGTIRYFENVGTPASASFEAREGALNPLSFVLVSDLSAPAFVDIDGDGDEDAYVGEMNGRIQHYPNIDDSRTGNRPPSPQDDVGETAEDTAVVIELGTNDGDPDGDALALAFVGPPAHGSAGPGSGLSLEYVPAQDFFGSDSLRYAVCDGRGKMSVATVRLEVTPVNDAPAAPVIATPPDGTILGVPEVGGGSLRVTWTPSFDVEDDTVTYEWQLAKTSGFEELLLRILALEDTSIVLGPAVLEDVADSLGLVSNEMIPLHHRVVASDGDLESGGAPLSIVLLRGAVNTGAPEAPHSVRLHGGAPNPASDQITVRFDLPARSEVTISVYDLLGRRVLSTPPMLSEAGAALGIRMDVSSLPAGAYVFEMVAASMDGTTRREGGKFVVVR